MESSNKSKKQHKCCFTGCNNTKDRNPSHHFFSFPIKRAEICEQWIVNCSNETLSSLAPTTLKRKVVCELHFKDKCFTSCMKSRLNPDAVPTKLSLDSPHTPAQTPRDSAQVAAYATMPSTSRRSLFTTPPTAPTSGRSTEPPGEESPNTTPVFKKFKSVKGRIQTPGKITPIKRRLHNKFKNEMKLKKKYQQAARRLKDKPRKLSKADLLEAIQSYLPEKVSNFFAMQLNHCRQTTKPYTDKEKQQALSYRYKSPALYNQMRDEQFALPSTSTILQSS